MPHLCQSTIGSHRSSSTAAVSRTHLPYFPVCYQMLWIQTTLFEYSISSLSPYPLGWQWLCWGWTQVRLGRGCRIGLCRSWGRPRRTRCWSRPSLGPQYSNTWRETSACPGPAYSDHAHHAEPPCNSYPDACLKTNINFYISLKQTMAITIYWLV